MVIHDIETNAVEAVFYPVVPDSFMPRDGASRPRLHLNAHHGLLANEMDSPILAPHDPWSF